MLRYGFQPSFELSSVDGWRMRWIQTYSIEALSAKLNFVGGIIYNHVVAFCRAIYPTTECRRLLLKLYSTLGHNHRILFPMNMLM